ncbi:hypothetical protein F2Q70_00017047 [Brassica cretica]|uniref:Uncharacterized protein n=1 Tax=Brassica cretica TaxID=69181 RepID=A0A3N6RI24_BRACR|nr:hypothetical protein F2Q70_00017047 [Brassica cretica]KAF2597618.1 hypothetical protein F2Q68_00009995 [Brassica cretica]
MDHRRTASHCEVSPERRSRRVSIPSRCFFFLDPTTGEGDLEVREAYLKSLNDLQLC